MNKILDHLIATDFRDLAGTKVDGQLALSDELVNLGLTDFLNSFRGPAPASPPRPSPETDATAPSLDPKVLLAKATVHHLKYRTEKGRTILEINAEL